MSEEHIAEESGRLDSILAVLYPDKSRSEVQKWIKDGFVDVNGVVVTKSGFQISEGDSLTVAAIHESQLRKNAIDAIDLQLSILHEDDSCLVLNKPAGFAVHPAGSMDTGEQTILHGIAFLFEERGLPFSSDAVLVHRLDKETTGCLLVAKSKEAHTTLQKQFEERSVEKIYLALTAGVPSPPQAMIDSPIGRNLTDRTKMSILKTSVSREAQTTYSTMDAGQDCALLECTLHTGRTHQIRVHLSSVGHPILGDPTYHSGASRKLTDSYGIDTLCLHAWKLSFDSPVGGRHSLTAPLPAALVQAIAQCGLTVPS